MDRGIRGGLLHARLVGLGAMAAERVFMLLVYFGVIHFLNIPFTMGEECQAVFVLKGQWSSLWHKSNKQNRSNREVDFYINLLIIMRL
ncbi:hypothetical protein ABN764_04065 [Paenibacillaceae sp. P-4]